MRQRQTEIDREIEREIGRAGGEGQALRNKLAKR